MPLATGAITRNTGTSLMGERIGLYELEHLKELVSYVLALKGSLAEMKPSFVTPPWKIVTNP